MCRAHMRKVCLILAFASYACLPDPRRVPLPESLLHDDSGSESGGEDDPVERSMISAGSFRHSEGAESGGKLDNGRSRASSIDEYGGDTSTSAGRSNTGPHVVDRLRRTRAAAAAIGKK